MAVEATTHPGAHGHEGHGHSDKSYLNEKTGLMSWLITLDHKRIGMMYLLSVLTRNHFAEAIGYPDPLHKADCGAKTIGRAVGDTIQSSTRLLAARPISRTFRSIRDSRRR